MDKYMWFGNKRKMKWVPCPAVGGDYGRRGRSTSMDLRNGGAVSRLSMSGARSYSLAWALAPQGDISVVTDFAEGVYGPGHIYWSDPFNMDKNVLSQVFATPSLGGYDGPVLSGDASRPLLVPTANNHFGLPVESAVYTLTPSSKPLEHWVPIPPGHTAWVGAYGSSAGAYVKVQPTFAGNPTGSAINAMPTPVDASSRWTTSVNASASVDGVTISLGGTGEITLAGLAVRVMRTGFIPDNDGFIAGRGHAGCAFTAHPTIEAYSAALDLIGAKADFIEVGPWQS